MLLSLFAVSTPSLAEDAEISNVPCIGPMCMLTPVYRFGATMMPTMPDRAAAPAEAGAPATGQSASDANAAAAAVTEGIAEQTAAESRRPGTRDAHASVLFKRDRRAIARRSFASRTIPARLALRPTARPTTGGGNGAVVTIAAAGPELDRLLRLAAVVKTPQIRVMPAVWQVDGCSRKPADFVVDTMSNPTRLGPAIPLFTESLIIVARKDIRDLYGLRDRQVSFGLAGGSSQRVARDVFRTLGVATHEVPLDLDNALDALTLGDLDAIALLVPRGFDRLTHHDGQLHLISLPDEMRPSNGLKLTRIDPASYLGGTWSTKTLSVISVDAVLSPNHSAQMQPKAEAVYAALDRRSSELAANGFDLIGAGDGLQTMRSIAKDPVLDGPRMSQPGC